MPYENVVRRFKGMVIGPSTEGIALVTTPLSFLGDVDVESCKIIANDSPVRGLSIADHILIMERARGSTVSAYILYALARRGCTPRAIIMHEPDTVVLIGSIMSNITYVYNVEKEFFEFVRTGDRVRIHSEKHLLEVIR